MGVHGLWDLLAPVGRRVSVETLSGKKLAIDASIWMIQFMKAMRDDKGEMVRNAHLIGFFRRICKLLYLRTKPVFVFDGGTPALKRRTVVARRRQRENAQAKIRKTAEKLLLNHLKAMRLKELANDLENQRKRQSEEDAKGKNVSSDIPKSDNVELDHCKLDEMLAASIAAEEGGNLGNIPSTSANRGPIDGEVEESDDEEIILPGMDGKIDPSVLAALPPSMQLDLLMRESSREGKKMDNNRGIRQGEKHMNNVKGKEILSDEINFERNNFARDDAVAETYNQEKLDEMLAASIAAEEGVNLNKRASTSGVAIPSEEESGGEDEDEEMILPAIAGKVDPAVLAALPPSMQLDLLVQMRERLMAENRQRYQKVKKAPEKFSELQIEAYLKTVAFRREIDHVQKAAAGQGVGGVQTSRIASEANREFIFSSSFTGDKELFTSAGVQTNGDKQHQMPSEHPSSTALNNVTSIGEPSTVTGTVLDESTGVFDDDVETYLDERGRIRLSRVRAMGIRMTRDLQRNLDLMKEIEQEKRYPVKTSRTHSAPKVNKTGAAKSLHNKTQQVKNSEIKKHDPVNLNERNGQSMVNNESTIQISFEVDGEIKSVDSDDDIFASLVEGKPIKVAPADNSMYRQQPSDCDSDDDWEEGIIEGKPYESFNNVESGNNPDSEVEWEEGVSDVAPNSSCPVELGKSFSKGHMEEEANLQEAIRRSLEDLEAEKFSHAQSEKESSKSSMENAHECVGVADQGDYIVVENVPDNVSIEQSNAYEHDGIPGQGELEAEESVHDDDNTEQSKSFLETSGVEKLDVITISEAFSSEGVPCESSESHNIGKSSERFLGTSSGKLSDSMNRVGSLCSKMPSSESIDPSLPTVGQTSKMVSDGFHISKAVSDDVIIDVQKNTMEAEPSMLVNDVQIGSEMEPSCHFVPCKEQSPRVLTNDIGVQELGGGRNSLFSERDQNEDKSTLLNNENVQLEFAQASLDEEILNLGQERMNLGDEQRKLERNAESVSSEMFAECQELLQMFGLPYIIAPMEAEAQCAYMELTSLVDGVVTDDSDVFLFGARSVYKNIFDDRKYVETYFMKDIEKELGLTREKLIRMALLLGSDYTEGVSGIGIVNAIEVVSAFPEDDGLHKFREWIESPDPSILGKLDAQTGTNARKKGSKPKASDHELNFPSNAEEESKQIGQNIPNVHEENEPADNVNEIKLIFMEKHRNVSKNWHIPPSFPSDAVISAYSSPQVDKSTEPFSWGKPDIRLLHRLCWEKFGWSIQKSDELLQPVLNEYNKHETQLRLEAFYTFNEKFAKIRSKRIKKAVKGIAGNHSADVMDDSVQEVLKSGKKRRIKPSDSGMNKSAKTAEAVPVAESNSLEQSAVKQSRRRRRRRASGDPVLSKMENSDQQCQAKGSSSANGNGRGRGRGRKQEKRGRGKGVSVFEQSDSECCDFSSSADEPESRSEKSEHSEVRRSTRSRKPVQYAASDLEVDDIHIKSLDEGDAQGSSDEDTTACPSSKQGHEVENPSVEDFSRDYLEKGGGFCADDTSQPSDVNISTNAYLKIGGGFCIDEGKDLGASCYPSTARDEAAANASHVSVSLEEIDCDNIQSQSIAGATNELHREGGGIHADKETNIDFVNASYSGHSNVGVCLSGNTENNTEESGIRGLSAMPLLRRKRRKT